MKEIVISQSHTLHTGVIDRYLIEISRYKLLTGDEEVLLCTKIQAGDKGALDKLVNANLRFVVTVAKKYQNMGLALEDLISEGNAGLIKAAGLFDSTRGFKFISFAVWWIRQSMIQAIDRQRRIIKLPGNIIVGIQKIRRLEEELEQSLERMPSPEEVAEKMLVSEGKVADYLSHTANVVSLDRPFDMESGTEGNLTDLLEDMNSAPADSALLAASKDQDLQRLLNQLTERERKILMLVFGIGNGYPMQREDVGREGGLSQEPVRQLKVQALKKLRLLANKELFYSS